MSKNTTTIRITCSIEVERILKVVRRRYPALNDPEIFKLALSHLLYEPDVLDDNIAELRSIAAHAVGLDYLSDPAEDIYHEGMGKKVSF